MRSLRLVRYLPQFGWRPIVVTSERGFDMIHGDDHSLIQKIPAATHLLRVRDPLGPILKSTSAKIGRHIYQVDRACKLLAFPDEKIFWAFRAYKTALSYFEKTRPDVIYATGFPWSSLLVGMWLKRVFNKPLIVDLRDPWTLSPMPVWSKFPHHRNLERKIMQAADTVIFTSESTAEEYRRHYSDLAEKITTIPNGFDPDDFAIVGSRSNHRTDNKFKMIYAGSLSDAIPPAERTRTLVPLLNALQAFKEKYAAASKRVVLEIYSNDIPSTRKFSDHLGLSDLVKFMPRISHREITKKICDANMGVLVIQASADGSQIVAAKLYEYIAAGLPVLALAPMPSETAKIIGRYGLGYVFSHRQHPGEVAEMIYRAANDRMDLAKLAEAQAEFNGVNLVGKLASRFDELIKENRHEVVAS